MTAAQQRTSQTVAALLAPIVAFRSLRSVPGVLRLQLVNGLAVTGRWAGTVALTVAAFRVGGPELVAISVIVSRIPSVLFSPALGSNIEWRAPLTVLRVSLGAATVLAAVAGFAVMFDAGVIVAIAAGAGLGLCGVARRVANSVVTPSMVEDSAQLTGVAVIGRGVDALGLAIGPAIAGVLVAVAGPSAAYGAVFVVNLLGAIVLRHLHGAGTTPLRTGRQDPGGVIRLGPRSGTLLRPLRNRGVRRIVVLCAAQSCFYGALNVLIPPLVVNELAAGEGGVGLLNAAMGVGGVIAFVPLFSITGTRRLAQLLVVGLILSAAPVVPAAVFDPGLVVVVVLFGVIGWGDVMFLGTMVSVLQRASDASTLGRSFALVEAAQAAGIVVGAIVGALLTDLDPSTGLAIVGGAVAALAVLNAPWATLLDRRLAPPTELVAKLRRVPLFHLLSAQAIERLALGLERQSFEPKDRIITQGEPGTRYYLIDSGTVAVTVDDRRVRTLESGDGFGEIALMRVMPRTATCEAVTPVEVLAIEGEDFLAVLGLHSAALDEMAGQRLSDAAPRPSRLSRFD